MRRKRNPNTASNAASESAQKSMRTPGSGANAAAARGKLLARSPGTCQGCGEPYPKGAALGRIGEGWGHEACAKIMAETEKIRSGATFRSQRTSTWRRGAGPGKTRDRF